MKSLHQYIRESILMEDDEPSPEELGTAGAEDDAKTTERGDIKFTIWGPDGKQKKWITSPTEYRKIEYLFEDTEKHITIDFLLGFSDKSWKLWAGKSGSVSYDDKPVKDLKEKDFPNAIVAALDSVEEIIKDVRKNPGNWGMYYVSAH